MCFQLQRLVHCLRDHGLDTQQIRRQRTDMWESTLIGVWVLFNPDTFRSLGENFDVSPSVAHVHYKKTVNLLCGVGHRFIKWPSEAERQRCAVFYERNFGFPGVVGSIDCTLIPITAPKEQKQRYVDRHQQYSINVQIVSDEHRRIRDCFVGIPGSVNDNRVFRLSPLAKNLFSRPEMLDENEHLVGDGAYATTSKVRL